MQENTDKNLKTNSNADINKKSDKKKFALVIDYSKFQQKFISNNNNPKPKKDLNINENDEKGIKEEEKVQNEPQNKKNLEQFLNISGILNESQSSLLGLENQNSNMIKEDEDLNYNNKNNNSTVTNKINKNIINDCLDDISINDKEQNILLSVNYKNLIKNNIKNSNKKNTVQNKKREKSFDDINAKKYKTSFNTSKKKNKYAKFVINKNNEEIERKNIENNLSNDKNALTTRINKKEKINSYAQIIKNNNNMYFANNNNYTKIIQNENNSKANSSFTLFNGINHKHNISNFSEISYNALSTAAGDINDNSKNRNKIKKMNNKKLTNNIIYSNFSKKYNLNTFHQKNKSYDAWADKNKNTKNNLLLYNNGTHKINNRKISSKTIINESNNKKNKNNNKNDDVIYLLDNIKNKYQNQENKFINQQKNMKNEINILKEKLKKLSVNEALYQVEIEKLKRNKNISGNTTNTIPDIKYNIKENKDTNLNQNFFGEKLDNIIQKYNQNPINNSINKNNNLIEIFGLNKDIFEGENMNDENDNNNYIEIFSRYPSIKKFIQILIKKYKNEKEYRMRLEEKTIEIFTNDIKKINYLEKKIKKLENDKHYRVNSSLNYSYDNDLSEGNISKNSC